MAGPVRARCLATCEWNSDSLQGSAGQAPSEVRGPRDRRQEGAECHLDQLPYLWTDAGGAVPALQLGPLQDPVLQGFLQVKWCLESYRLSSGSYITFFFFFFRLYLRV